MLNNISGRNFRNHALFLFGSALGIPSLSFSKEHQSFLQLQKNGKLDQWVEQLYPIYENFHLCPRDCRIYMIKGQTDRCQATAKVKVS